MSLRIASLLPVASLLVVAACGGPSGNPADPASAAAGSHSTTPAPVASPTPTAPDSGRPTAPPIDVPSNLDELVASANAATAIPTDGADRRVFGADASWPQCPKGMGIPKKRSKGAPMPTGAARFVVLGLTNGPSFTPNPCLADQVRWARSRGLMLGAYAVVSFPDKARLEQVRDHGPYDGSNRLGALRNAGYQAGRHTLATMRKAGLEAPAIWIDVEPVPDFAWSSDTVANAAVVEGTARAYTDAGKRIGYYSVASLWTRVVGDLRTNAPEWRAAGQTSMAEALSRCAMSSSFGGGPAVIAQWVEDGRDRNVTCPGQGGRLGLWFSRP